MKRTLGPRGSLVVSLLALVVGSALTVSTLVAQQALATRGAHGVADVVAARHGAGRLSQDSIDVVLADSRHRGPLTVTRFDGQVRVGDRIDVLFDREDPSTIIQDGHGLWGPIELLMPVLAVIGLVFSAHGVAEVSGHRRRRRRGARVPVRAPTAALNPGPPAKRNPGLRRRRRRRR